MATAAVLTVEINGKDTGVARLLDQIEQRLQRTNRAAQQAGQGIGQSVGSGTRQASSGVLSLQQAQARLEAQQGNLAAAAQRLRDALAQQSTTTVQTINAQRQLLTVEEQLATGTSRLGGYFQGISSQIGGLPGQLLSVSSGIGAVTIAAGAAASVVKSFSDAFEFKANLDATTRSIELQLKGVRDSAETFAQARAFADRYKLTQEELNGALQASVGVFRQSKASADEILGTLLRLQQLSPEQGLEGAALALKELAGGSTQSLVGRFEVSTSAAAKMREEIKGGADAVQVLSQYLEQSGIGMDSLAARTEGAKGKMLELKQAQEQLTLAQAEFAQGPGLQLLEARINVTRDATKALGGDFQALNAIVNDSGVGVFNPLIGALGAYNNAVLGAGRSTLEWLGILQPTAAATQQNTQATADHALSMDTERQAAAAAGQALQEHTTQLEQDAAKAQLDALASQELAAQKQILAQQAQIAANAVLSSGGNIQATAARLAASSSLVDQLTAAYLRLAAAQGAATQAKLNNQTARQLTGADSDAAAIRGFKRSTVVDQRNAEKQAAQDAARAQEKYQTVLGNYAPSIAHARAELAQLTKGSAAYYDKLAEITKLEQQQTSAAKKGRGGAGGGKAGKVKLTEQQKLENSLLTDQDKYQQDSEDAAAKHAVKLIEIQLDFNEKMQKAQQQFQQDQLDSRASFYDNLGKIENAGLRKSFSEQYEAAFAEAEQIAKEKGADVADAYLKEKQRVIEARAQRAAEIEQARKDKDKDKEEYLKGVDKLYQQSEDARLARIKEGNDSIASERDKAIAEENNAYIDQQNQLSDKVNESADRRIAAAQREGKAIDATRLSVDGLADSYDKVNRAAGVPPAGSTNAPTSTSATAAQGVPAAPEAANSPAVVSLTEGQFNALLGRLSDLLRAEQDTARAVNKQVNTGGIAG
jgi:hypothetical protein